MRYHSKPAPPFAKYFLFNKICAINNCKKKVRQGKKTDLIIKVIFGEWVWHV